MRSTTLPLLTPSLLLAGTLLLSWSELSLAQTSEPAPPSATSETLPSDGSASSAPDPLTKPTDKEPKEPKASTSSQLGTLAAGASAPGSDTGLLLSSTPSATTDAFTGTMSAALPVLVPPGRLGMQPALSLAYWSGNGNGWLGMGWKLEVGAIERQTRFGVNYTGDEYTFRLSGATTDLVSIGSGEYRAKIEGGFSRVRKLTAADGKPYWEATDKKGTRYLFGQTAASRQADPADASRIFKWDLDRVEDPHGNYLTATYTADQGQSYLDHIDYTGHGSTDPTNTVKFHLEDRSDAPPMYATNFLVKTAKRLKTIEIKATGALVRAYKLSYTTGTSTSRSLLASVQSYGKDAVLDGTGTVTGGSALPGMAATWNLENDGTFAIGPSATAVGGNGYFKLVADLNGDGRTDLVAVNESTGNAWGYLSNGDGTFTVGPAATGVGGSGYTKLASDLNGDGKTDLVAVNNQTDNAWGYLSNGDGTFTVGPAATVVGGSGYTKLAADLNGDGKTDLVTVNESNGKAWGYLSNGDGTFTVGPAATVVGGSGYTKLAGDLNGDGKTDLVAVNNQTDNAWGYLSNGDGTFTVGPAATAVGGNGYFKLAGDLNGDGRTDLVTVNESNGNAWGYLSKGDGTFAVGPAATVVGGSGYTKLAGDLNGDGRTDLVAVNESTGNAWGYLSNGDGTFTVGPAATAVGGNGYFKLAGDLNGDGKTDLVAVNNQTDNAWGYLSSGQGSGFLLVALSNGLGSTTTVAYTPSTQYANTQLPFPIQTVSSITTNDGNGNVSTTTYTYSGGFYHIGERDLRGFNYAKATGPVGPNGEQAITETWFHQGNDTAVDVNNPNVPDGYMKGKPYKARVSDGASHLYSETRTTYAAGPTSAPFFNPPAQVVTDICDGGACGKQTRADYTHDAYGNVIREDQHGDTSDPSDDRTVVRTFSPNTTAWIVGLPAGETIYQGIGTANQAAQSSFYYDGVADCTAASTNQTPTKGNLTRVVRWLNGGTSPETRMAYDAYGNLTCTRDANGNTTTMSYDGSFTFPKVVTNPLGHVKTTQYYGVDGVPADTGLYGQVKSVTDPNNAVISTTYDVFGRPLQTTFPDTSWTSTAYLSFGTVGAQHVRTDSAAGLSSWTYFDGLGRTFLAKSTGPDSKTIATQTQYNVRGAVLQTSLPYFDSAGSPLWRVFRYDPVGRVTQATNPDASRTLACYDDWVTVTVDANNHQRRETRDAYGRLTRVDEYTGTSGSCTTSVGTPYATTTYQYDVLGNLLTVTDAKGNQSTMTYDTLSRKTAMHDPDMGNWSYVYDAAGNLTQQNDAKSQAIYFRYDALNRRAQKDYGTQKPLGSGDVRYFYDQTTSNGKGRLTEVQDASGKTTFFYDAMGRTTKSVKCLDDPYACAGGTSYPIETTYDLAGRVSTIKYPDLSVVSYAYNGPLLLKAYEGATTYGQYGGYNALGQPGTLTFGNGVVTTYTYSNTGNPTCSAQNFWLCTLKTVLGTNPAYQDLTYGYDLGGNITGMTDVVNGNQTFTYDGLNRLDTATGPYGTHDYNYDEIGNLTANPLLGSYTYPPSGPGSIRPHAVTTAGANTYGYDNNGNMTSGAGRTLTYDFENRPTSITSGGVTTTMTYDGDGGRVKKSTPTETVRYVGKLYECLTTGGPPSCQKYIFAGSQRLAVKQVTSGAVDYYHQDHLGSSSVITDGATGVVEENLAYYPFGATRVDTHTPADVPFKYTGQELDSSTGLYFYGARYYDATLSRFISADTIVPSAADPQSLNRYSYARNNPIILTDPTGQFWEIVAAAFIIGGVVSGIQSDWDPTATLIGATSAAVGAGAGVGTFGAVEGLLGTFVGGAVAGAVGGGTAALTSNTLYTAAGYDVDWGRTLAAGIVGGGVGGGLGGYIGGYTGLFVGAAAGGATAAAIAGGDPGLGAGYAALGAALHLGYLHSASSGIQSSTAEPDTKIKILARKVVAGVEHLIIELPGGTRFEMGPEGGIVKVFESSDPKGSGLLPRTQTALEARTFISSETSVNMAQLMKNIANYRSVYEGRAAYNPVSRNSNYFVNSVVSGAGGNPVVPGAFTPAFGGVTGPVPYIPYGLVPAFGR
jgi:RHS repeat-associated protein